jgi:hypothetical protein
MAATNDEDHSPHEREAPAFYAQPRFLSGGTWREWWTILHPPYTLLNLSLVTVGACLTGPVSASRLIATLAAFFLAVGVGAHCLDELHGRPLRTTMPSWRLILASIVSLGGAVALGIVGVFIVSTYLTVFIVVGVIIAVGYNLELFGGRLHTTAVVVMGWGGFPILTAYFAQHGNLSLAVLPAAVFGTLITLIQQQLSTPARDLRRRTSDVQGFLLRVDGSTRPLTKQYMLEPLERSLKTLCWSGPALAASLILARFVH